MSDAWYARFGLSPAYLLQVASAAYALRSVLALGRSATAGMTTNALHERYRLGQNPMMITRLRTCFLAALAAAAVAAVVGPPAMAAPSRAELENRIIQLENTQAEVEAKVDRMSLAGDPAAVRLEQRMDAVQAELARVVGELEEARFQNGRLQNDLRTLRRELQLRDAEVADKLGLEPAFVLSEEYLADNSGLPNNYPAASGQPRGGVRGAPTTFGAAGYVTRPAGDGADASASDPSFYGDDPFAAARAAANGPAGDEVQVAAVADNPVDALADAKRLLIEGRFSDAEVAFQDFDTRFAESDQAGEALYWHGETLFARDDFEPAKNLYIESLRRDPTGARAPDAMVQLAAALQRMDFTSEACNTLAAFPRQFPNASLSVKSKAERVRQMAGCR